MDIFFAFSVHFGQRRPIKDNNFPLVFKAHQFILSEAVDHNDQNFEA